jgi:thiosulfate/3-mercaptopyruvate sulfurtransferase
MYDIKSLTTNEMMEMIGDPDEMIVDIRPVEAFNGWALKRELRGGHIRGAISFPYAWTQYTFELQELLMNKQLTTDKSIVLYGYDRKTTTNMAHMLREAGFERIRVYHHFADEWSADPDRPVDGLPRYRNLVYPRWLNELINGHRPPEYTGKKFVICHAHYRNIDAYSAGHIPGAIPLDTLTLESPETWNRRSDQEIRTTLEGLGITHDTTVILYGRFSSPSNEDPFPGSSAGHLGAMRCAAIMLYAGVEDVRVLNGGLISWQDAGYPISRETTHPKPVDDFGISIPAHPEYFVDLAEAKKILRSDDAELVCVRSWREYIGEVSGYHYIEKKGRIPGVVFGNCGSDAYHMENYRNVDHTTREYQEIIKEWKKAGVVPEKHNAFYCGTGWRGSEAFFNAFLLDWPRISVFDGGWFEWSKDPNNPVETGPG